MVDRQNELCLGPEPDKCADCTDIESGEIRERQENLKRYLAGVDSITANSEYTRGLAKRFLPTDKDIGVETFTLEELPLYRKRKKVGFFGYFNPVKGINTLLQASMKTRWVQYLLFCDVPEPLLNGRQIYGMDNVLVMGSYRRSDMPLLCNLVDAAVVPSLSESFGLTARELRELGLPVLSTSTGGQDGQIRPADVDALADAIQEVAGEI